MFALGSVLHAAICFPSYITDSASSMHQLLSLGSLSRFQRKYHHTDGNDDDQQTG